MPLASTVHYHSEHCLNLITTLIMHSIMIREQEIRNLILLPDQHLLLDQSGTQQWRLTKSVSGCRFHLGALAWQWGSTGISFQQHK